MVPTGKVEVALYPESGDLVAGIESRVYVEATDALGRPVEAAVGELPQIAVVAQREPVLLDEDDGRKV